MADDDLGSKTDRKPTDGNALVSINVSNLVNLNPIGKLGTRIVDQMFGGAARLYNDATAIWSAKRHAKADLIQTEAQVQKAAMLASIDPTSLEGRAALRIEYEAVRQQQNIENVVRRAVEYANEQEGDGKSAIADETPPLDEGWLFQFNDICKKATKDEMQRLLGKILAKEVAQPGKFSVRAIMTLTTISRAEAEAFRVLCQCHVRGLDIPKISVDWTSDAKKKYYGLSFGQLVLCRSAGLVHDSDSLKQTLEIPQGAPVVIYYGKHPLLLHSEKPIQLAIPTIALTTVGQELVEIIDVDFNQQFYVDLKTYMQKQGVELFTLVEYAKHQNQNSASNAPAR